MEMVFSITKLTINSLGLWVWFLWCKCWEKSDIFHDTQCFYWNQVSLNNIQPNSIPCNNTVFWVLSSDMISLFFQVDVFEIEAVELQDIEEVLVGHDGTTHADGYFLSKLVVREMTTRPNREYVFQHDRWGKCWVEIKVVWLHVFTG